MNYLPLVTFMNVFFFFGILESFPFSMYVDLESLARHLLRNFASCGPFFPLLFCRELQDYRSVLVDLMDMENN